MADRHPMWKDLGMDIEKHDVLCSVLPGAFGDVFMSQKKQTKGYGILGYGSFRCSRNSSSRIN